MSIASTLPEGGLFQRLQFRIIALSLHVIPNSTLLQHLQKRGRGKQLIHNLFVNLLTKNKVEKAEGRHPDSQSTVASFQKGRAVVKDLTRLQGRCLYMYSRRYKLNSSNILN